MTAYIRAADAIRDAFGCAVIIVHHCGIDATRPRGHTALAGAVDAQLAVKRDGSNNIVVNVEHMKDGPEGDTLTSALERVVLGKDDDGDEISSCVVVSAEPAPRSATNRRLSDKQKLAMAALDEALLSHGQPASTAMQLPAGVKTIGVDQWRNELFARGVLDHDHPNPRQDYKRLKDALAARTLIAERSGVVWKVTV
jgi:hypothetical protein